MEEKIKVNYEQIKKANEEIASMKVGNGNYAKVSERVKAYRKVYPTGSIETEIENITEEEARKISEAEALIEQQKAGQNIRE